MASVRLIWIVAFLSAIATLLRVSSCFPIDRFSHDEAVAQMECVQCHIPPQIGYHVTFGQNCEKCHQPTTWLPANYEHLKFPISDDHYSTCITCHPNSLNLYTCYGCHDHTEEEMISQHAKLELDSSVLKDCVICHPDAKIPKGFDTEGE